ncbi:MAG: ATP-binding protein [Sedimentisphaerales bacterium]|nr:ATP-binding protein [Sedimentisphaerales bacterium]
MIKRKAYISQVSTALKRSPIVALLGPRQCGKTTLAKIIGAQEPSTYFDLESQTDIRRLANPEMMLASLSGLVVIDEIQILPELFSVLRVVVDKPENQCRFLILGSASPDIVKNVSETLAGRIEFVDMSGFDLTELGAEVWQSLWVRGGFPRSYLADSDQNSFIWREGFIRTFLQRDIPQLGINIPAQAVRRFWTMIAHYHGQVWNASRIASAMGVNDKTVRSYLDILTETYMIRQLQPWHENIRKRQVKSPKIYFRDTGLLHSLLDLQALYAVTGHPQVGASWEGFAIEQILRTTRPSQAYYWATYSGAELDMFFVLNGLRYGIEFKFSEAPDKTKSMSIAIDSLKLHKLLIVYPGEEAWPISEKITACPIMKVNDFINMEV